MSSRFGLKYGAVIFDDPSNPTEGWACTENQDSAKRVRGMGDLRTDTIWWTNIPHSHFFGSTNAWRNTWLRHDKYLPISPYQALQEWGYDPDTTNGAFQAWFAAQLFRRVMLISEGLLLPMFSDNPHPDDVFAHRTLREDMRVLLPKLEYPAGAARDALKDGRAFQQFTRTFRSRSKSDKMVKIRKPRIEYAKMMLTSPVPVGPFEVYTRQDLSDDPRERIGNIFQDSTPILAEVTINEIDESVSPVFAFGSGLDRNKKVMRHWAAHPELSIMSNFTKMDIGAMYAAQGGHMKVIDHLPDHIQHFLNDIWQRLSWSAGIVAEAIWRAMLLPEPKGANASHEPARTSWQGLWTRAYDRMRLYVDAQLLDVDNFPVFSYGYGWINVATPEESVDELIQNALSLGYLPQLIDAQPQMWDDPAMPGIEELWSGSKNTRWFASLIAKGMRKRLWMLDQIPLQPTEKRPEIVKKLWHQDKAA